MSGTRAMNSPGATAAAAAPAVSARNWCAIIGGLIGGFMAILDIQITNSSMKVIQGALSATLGDSSWLMTAYFTAEIVAIPLCGWLSQALGTSRYALWCIVSFLAASLLCSFAWNLDSMIIFRALQGFSGGALIPIAFRLIIEILPKEKRPFGMSLFSIISTFAPAIGPAMGGWLTDSFSWHAIFYINAVPALLAFGLISYGLKHPPIRWQVIRDGDYTGIVTGMLWLGTLEVILEEGRNKGWLESDLICTLAVISTLSFLWFLYDQLVHPRPLVNIRMFRDSAFAYATVIFAMLGVAIYGTLFLVPYYLTMIHDYNASQIGNVVIWMGLPQLAILPFIPWLLQRVNPKYMIFIGFSGLAISAFMNCHMDSNFAGPEMKLSLLIRALGQPFIMVPLSIIATRNVQAQDSASSAVLINIFRSIGGSCGTAILTTVFADHARIHAAQIQSAMASGSDAFTRYLSSIKILLAGHGSVTNSLHVEKTAYSILANNIKIQAEVISFNDMFFIMGGMMLATAFLALFATRNFQLFHH
ncbi:DHA2 family efflux MFS transporter permease subunit [Pectobacteriaceae bacterium CE90]|nr:DHA2 family efflux MFS transporter permease subunit [Pectobacteriaceae bacterium CE90]